MRIEVTVPRESTIVGGLGTSGFTISQRAQAHFISQLRDGIYSDAVLALQRELTTNAVDAHVDAGKPDLPIKVVQPTAAEASFWVRDWGKGLRPGSPFEDITVSDILGPSIFGTVTYYGETTKDDSNLVTGCFGIGMKSPFAYNDTFSITSWNGGMKRVFIASIGEDNMGEVTLFQELLLGEHLEPFLREENLLEPDDVFEADKLYDLRPYLDRPSEQQFKARALALHAWLETGPAKGTSLDEAEAWMAANTEWGPSQYERLCARLRAAAQDAETGLQVKVPVKPSDIWKFRQTARKLFPFFRVQPDMNVEVEPPAEKFRCEHGRLLSGRRDSLIVMGNIPYSVDTSKVKLPMEGMVLEIPIGHLQVTLSREAILYRGNAVEIIEEKAKALRGELEKTLEAQLANPDLSEWQRWLLRQEFRRDFRYGEQVSAPALFTNRKVGTGPDGEAIFDSPRSFQLYRQTDLRNEVRHRSLKATVHLILDPETQVFIRDTKRTWRGHIHDRKWAMVVEPKKGYTAGQALAEFNDLVERRGLSGVPVSMISSIPYISFSPRRSSASREKLQGRFFRPVEGFVADRNPGSHNWENLQDGEEPGADDVFVCMFRYRPLMGDHSFLELKRGLEAMCEKFDIPAPNIYGMKTGEGGPTEKERAAIPGLLLEEWLQKESLELLETRPELRERIEARLWSNVRFRLAPGLFEDCILQRELREILTRELGLRHQITQLYMKFEERRRVTGGRSNALEFVEAWSGWAPEETPDDLIGKIRSDYPLLSLMGGDALPFSRKAVCAEWIRYVKQVDLAPLPLDNLFPKPPEGDPDATS